MGPGTNSNEKLKLKLHKDLKEKMEEAQREIRRKLGQRIVDMLRQFELGDVSMEDLESVPGLKDNPLMVEQR